MNLTKTFLFTATLFVTNLGIAQEFQGMAVYETKTDISGMKGTEDNNIPPDVQKKIEEGMKKMSEKTFVLTFDKSASIYKEDQKLDAPGQGGGIRMIGGMMDSGGTYYKNVKSKSYVVEKEFMGKDFLVKDTLSKFDWKMEGASKMIGGYNCFKATAILKVADPRSFITKKENVEKGKGTDTSKKTNFMNDMVIPKEIIITAWYTPEIPVNQGPGEYWGLPGLILEVNAAKTVILCSKVVLNLKEKTEIKAPTNGKEVSQKEYNETVMTKIEEMREMNQGRGGNGGIQLRIGG